MTDDRSTPPAETRTPRRRAVRAGRGRRRRRPCARQGGTDAARRRDGALVVRRGPARPGGAHVAAPRRRAVHRARGRHRGRVPPAAPGEGRARRASGAPAPSTDAENSLRELAALAETAGSQVLDGLLQRRRQPDPGTFLGSGKAAELRDPRRDVGADTVVVRRRARPVPAPCAGGHRQGQGHRPDRADPRHLRPARQVAGRARPRSSWRSSSTCCRACAAGASRCPGRPVAGSAARRRAWARAVPVRRRSSSTGGASATAWPSCAARSRRWSRPA